MLCAKNIVCDERINERITFAQLHETLAKHLYLLTKKQQSVVSQTGKDLRELVDYQNGHKTSYFYETLSPLLPKSLSRITFGAVMKQWSQDTFGVVLKAKKSRRWSFDVAINNEEPLATSSSLSFSIQLNETNTECCDVTEATITSVNTSTCLEHEIASSSDGFSCNLEPNDIYDYISIKEDHFDLVENDFRMECKKPTRPQRTLSKRKYDLSDAIPQKCKDIYCESSSQANTTILAPECFVDHHVTQDIAFFTGLFHKVCFEMDWSTDLLPMGAFLYETPRDVVWVTTNPDHNYNYVRHSAIPKPLHDYPALQSIWKLVEGQMGYKPDGVFCNYFCNGSQYINWHSDDEDGLGEHPCILSISLQHPDCKCRKFLLRKIQKKHSKRVLERWVFPLQHGTVIVMRGATQHKYEHSVPVCWTCPHPRVNLNFRQIKTETPLLKMPNLPLYKPESVKNPPMYGFLPKFPVGSWFKNRVIAWEKGVHRHQIQGIVGNMTEGAESVVLAASCYENVDKKYRILYAGSGRKGEQTNAHGNGALKTSQKLKKPVRVFRSNGCSRYYTAQQKGKRGLEYAGLFYVLASIRLDGKFYFELHQNKDEPPLWIKNGTVDAPKNSPICPRYVKHDKRKKVLACKKLF